MRAPWCFFLLLLLCTIGSRSYSAEIRRSEHPLYGFILEGAIVPGDYDKLRKLIEADCPAKYYNSACASSIYLASPGGSVVEAMKIGRLVRALRWETQIPEEAPADLRQKIITALKLSDPKANYLCASACFFAFVGGIERSPAIFNGILGIHRPFLSDADLKRVNDTQAIASATQVRTVVEAYLKEMGVASKYSDLMFSVPKDQVRWVDKASFEADFAGVISELKEWMNARCDKRTDTDRRLQELLEEKFERGQLTPADKEMRIQLFKKYDDPQINCELSVKTKMREDAWKAFQKL